MGSRMFLMLAIWAVFAKIQEEEGVLVLNEANFEEALAFQNGLLVRALSEVRA
jgi:hypothetical protein